MSSHRDGEAGWWVGVRAGSAVKMLLMMMIIYMMMVIYSHHHHMCGHHILCLRAAYVSIHICHCEFVMSRIRAKLRIIVIHDDDAKTNTRHHRLCADDALLLSPTIII